MVIGLRTLVVATATIPEAFYEDWKHTYYRASTSLQNRQRNLDEAAELIERVSNVLMKADLCSALHVLTFSWCIILYLYLQFQSNSLQLADSLCKSAVWLVVTESETAVCPLLACH